MQKVFIGAEAVVSFSGNAVLKKRLSKSYRDKVLDKQLISQRLKREKKMLEKALSLKINVPKVLQLDEKNNSIVMQKLDGCQVKQFFDEYKRKSISTEFYFVCTEIGRQVAIMHANSIIHGDLTTSNMIFNGSNVFFIDFGLSFTSLRLEDKAVDLHVLHDALIAKHFQVSKKAFAIISKAYEKSYGDEKQVVSILSRLSEVELRGRNKANY